MVWEVNYQYGKIAESQDLCPDCRAPVVRTKLINGETILLDPKLRIVIFDSKVVDDDGRVLNSERAFTAVERWTGQLVIGRNAIPYEVKQFRESQKINRPFTICRIGHLRTCEGDKNGNT